MFVDYGVLSPCAVDYMLDAETNHEDWNEHVPPID